VDRAVEQVGAVASNKSAAVPESGGREKRDQNDRFAASTTPSTEQDQPQHDATSRHAEPDHTGR
jgi:hypothetical protein